MIPLAVDREQLREDWEHLRRPLLLVIGVTIGMLLAVASIEYDYLVLDILYWSVFGLGVLLFAGRIYDRYTVADEPENATTGDTR